MTYRVVLPFANMTGIVNQSHSHQDAEVVHHRKVRVGAGFRARQQL